MNTASASVRQETTARVNMQSLLKTPAVLAIAFVLTTGLTYGMLAWSDAHVVDSETHVAAVSATIPSAFDTVSLEAHGAFVANLSQNKIVFSKNADVQLPLASLTKVMLILAIGDSVNPDDIVTISEGAVLRGEGGGPTVGERWRARDLIRYTLVVSSNVGAEALAEAAQAAIRTRFQNVPEGDAVVWRMNELAKELGLTKTYFLNASGLDISPTQPSAMGSARDAAILFAYAYRTAPEFFEVTTRATLSVGPLDGPLKVENNTNDAISQIPGLRMGKTGYTDLAGGNLGIIFENDHRDVYVATVLGSTQEARFTDMLSLTGAADR